MKRLAVIVVALALAEPAHAVTITLDLGGYLHLYADQRNVYYQSGEEFRIMGVCASGCTLYLSLPNACIGRGVHLMFHSPRDANGDKSEAARESTERARQWMLAQYPQWVQDFIKAAGGLSKRELWMGYPIASKHMRTCGKPGGKLVQTALPMPFGPKLVPVPRQKPMLPAPSNLSFTRPSEPPTPVVLSDLTLREMNTSELVQHRRRVTAWTLMDLRAKEFAARQVILDAQKRIEAILRSTSSEALNVGSEGAVPLVPPSEAQNPSVVPEQQLVEPTGKPKPRVRKKQNFNLR